MSNRLKTTLIAATLTAAWGLSYAAILRVADVGDVQSMDPHSLNETLQLSFTGNIYEALVARGKDMKLVPSLATQWKQTAPTVWRFELRRGVTFHDGAT
ncbi:MAG TPA: hypothetical protein VN755_06810, partial [Steroidobacteraceae bacterium]|nr:hypothetical protein [Steroidobacteraceae bacterium]